MSDFDSGNSVNCVLLDVNLYETKRENNWSPIPSAFHISDFDQSIVRLIYSLNMFRISNFVFIEG